MKTVTEMRAEIGELMKKLGNMKAQIVAENREPNEEERHQAAELLDKVDEIEKNIELEERIQATEEKLSKPTEKPIKPDVKTTTLSQKEQEKKDNFNSFGEQLRSVIYAGSPGGQTDPRLLKRAASGMSESVSSDGGFLVQKDFSSEIVKTVFETGKLAPRINTITISGSANGTKIPGVDESSRATGSRWGGIRMYWEEEAAEKTKSKPKFRMIELNLKKLIGLCYLTDELLADAAQLESIVRQGFENEMGFMIDEAVINGNGVGKPLGIMNAGCMVTVNKETGQTATTLVWENVINMYARLIADSRANAVWLINQDVEPQLASMSVAVGTGGIPVYMPAGGFAGATATPFATLLGRPVIPIEQCQTLGTSGDIILGDFSKYIGIVKGGMVSDMSIHVRFI